jgi:spermidine synthase
MGKNSNLKLLFSIALIGTAAITSQILLIREIVNLFAGNELIYGLTIFFWLILYSFGCGIIGRFSHKIKDKLKTFIALQATIAILLPIEIFITRAIGMPLGSIPSFTITLLTIFFVLAPITLILGFQFSLVSNLLSEMFQNDSSQISRVYIIEAIGSILGGIILTYLLIFYLNAFQISAILAILISFSLLLLDNKFTKYLFIIAILILIFGNIIDFQSSRLSWRGYNLLKSTDSPFGRIAIIEDHEAITFFENGGLFFSTADKAGNEEIAHLPMLMHYDPKDILLIGGGVSGITDEILKYPVKSLDYVELDYRLIELAHQFVKFKPEVNLFTIDGIKYINQTKKKYDLIIINLPDPSTAQINRFYTQSFFKACSQRINKGGIVCLTLDTSHSYIGNELRLLNQCIHKTFSSVFKNVEVIPGNSNYFIGSSYKPVTYRRSLIKRWEKRNIKTEYFKSDTLYFILWPGKIKHIQDVITFDSSTPINTNLRPISYYLELLIWSSHFYSPLKSFFYLLMTIRYSYLLILLFTFFMGIKLISLKRKTIKLPITIMLIGFAGMSVQLIILYTFQSLYGYIYQTIGLLTTAFMAGLTLGSFITYLRYKQIKNPLLILKIVLFLFIGLLITIFFLLDKFPLPLASLLISLPIGISFPLAIKIYEEHQKEIGSLAGILYGSDLLGGAFAAIVTTIFFIPIYGIPQSFIIAILSTIASLILLF